METLYNFRRDKLFYLLLASVLLGSSVSAVVSRLLTGIIAIGLIKPNSDIPALSPELISLKNYDLLEFTLTSIFAFLFFVVNAFIYRFFKKVNTLNLLKVSILPEMFLLLFSLSAFAQTHFINFSGKAVILMLIFGEIIYFLLVKLSKQPFLVTFNPLVICNGFLLGFYLLLIGNLLTTALVIPICLMISMPIFYIVAEKSARRFLSSPAHLLLASSIAFPANFFALLVLGLVFGVIALAIKDKPLHNIHISRFLKHFVYPVIVLFVLLFDPAFFVGNFDSVEEGFWLGWMQRLIIGESLYKDVAVHQPPLITWGMYLFSSFAGFSVYNSRLFLHLLQIAGLMIYYFVINRAIKDIINKIVAFLLILNFTSILVKNNVEIRTGVGLLALLVGHKFLLTKKTIWLVLAGVLCAVSVLVSTEVGIAAFISLLLTLLLIPRKLKNLGLLLVGVTMGVLPIIILLGIQGALDPAISQIIFYSRAFANGYFNTPLERAISLSFLRWHIIDEYLSSIAFMWELARLFVVSAIFFIAAGIYAKKVEARMLFIASIAFFGLILFRSTLGRSDFYHLLFVLLPSIVLIFYLTETLFPKKTYPSLVLSGVMLLFFTRLWFGDGFIDKALFKIQTYGHVIGSYKSYNLERSGILVGEEINTKDTEALVEYINLNSSPQDSIFVYPWMPELYFLANKKNATHFDTPYSFFSPAYQSQQIEQLNRNKPKIVVYNKEMRFGNLSPESLPAVNQYLQQNFLSVFQIGNNQILVPKQTGKDRENES